MAMKISRLKVRSILLMCILPLLLCYSKDVLSKIALKTDKKVDTKLAKKKGVDPQNQTHMAEVVSKPAEKKAPRWAKREKQGIQSRKTISSMDFEDLKSGKNSVIASGNKEVGIKYLEKMIPLCTDMQELEEIMIELGDLYYETGKKQKAFTMYREFVNLYPGSEKVEYALYRTLVCKFNVIAEADRDQTPTKEAIEFAKEFLDRSAVFTTYTKEVEHILAQCQDRLFENELVIFHFYLNSGRIASATKRLETINKEFGNLMPEFEPRVMSLEIELAQAQKQPDIADEKQQELITKFPEYGIKTALDTTLKKNKKHFSARF